MLLPGPSATTKSAVRATAGQFIENLIRTAESHGLDFGDGFLEPIGTAVLRIAVGEDDAAALLVKPGREMDGDRALADPALRICGQR